MHIFVANSDKRPLPRKVVKSFRLSEPDGFHILGSFYNLSLLCFLLHPFIGKIHEKYIRLLIL